ncbi:DNA-directed primase/polymerase protein-like [Pollicipes pollicipes]|uniref:DNA-directed primase/polymerase protein-like n=1 Tax=Pollicipes pollicipes TaxID=41117 RepID=UPI001884D19A|nr:DNA-directed primase/polymerase protein-like [Pollicipes pollicipes]
MVFGCEERAPGGGGRRVYLVCHPNVFWRCDVQKQPEHRCTYEVIRQGVPCKLYLDLEFDRTLNADRDGDAMVDLFIRMIAAAVDHLFQIKCTRRDVVDLCASSNKKFSRHLIFNSKGLVFKDNNHVGNLVKDICGAVKACLLHNRMEDLTRLGLQEFSKDELNTLRVTSSSEHSLFCDECVYTKNRNFRVYKSSKFGKRRPLVKSVHNQYTPHQCSKASRDPRDISSEEAFFLDSLVSYIECDPEPLVHHGRSDAAAPTRPLTAVPPGDCVDGGGGSCSPYLEIDRFVRDLVAPGGVRRWTYFADSERVVYDIVGYRFCQNVGRWHRSNNIIVVVNVREASFYQKCHDPACQGFRSDERALPGRLLPWRRLDEWDGDEADY